MNSVPTIPHPSHDSTSSELTDPQRDNRPIVVDLDGTLIHEESHQILWRYLWREDKQKALKILWIYLTQGSTKAKHELVAACPVQKFTWSFHQPLLKRLKQARSQHQTLILLTGAPFTLAQQIVEKQNLFDDIIASTTHINCVGRVKAYYMLERFGEKGFIYAGNAAQDCWVWAHAAEAWVFGRNWLVRLILLFLQKKTVLWRDG